MLAVRLPKEIDERLARLARETGRTKSYYVREALLRYLDDLEDAYLAEAAYERFLASKEEAIPLDDLEKRLGLED
jgi:RHH-type rel operon transcriptional repressor/antitoxin RelB